MSEKKSLWDDLIQVLQKKGYNCGYESDIFAPCGAKEKEVVYYNSKTGFVVYAESLSLTAIYSIRIYAELEKDSKLLSLNLYEPSDLKSMHKLLVSIETFNEFNSIWKAEHHELNLEASLERKTPFTNMDKLKKCSEEFKTVINFKY